MEKVLLINDSKFDAMVICDLLDNLGYEVKSSNEYEALLQMKIFEPSIVIANLIMKTMRGDDLIQKIKAYDGEIKCILSSSNDIVLGDFLKKNVDAVLHTPTTKDKMEQLIESLNRVEKLRQDDIKIEEPKVTQEKRSIRLEDIRKGRSERIEEKKTEVPKEEMKKEIAFCPYCGMKFENAHLKYAFCPSCGAKL